MYESEEGNIKMCLIGMVYKGMDSIQIADYGVQKLVFWIRGWMIVSFWKKKNTDPPIQVTESVKHVTFTWIFLDPCNAYWGVSFASSASRQAEEHYLKFSSTSSFQILTKSSLTSRLSVNIM